MVADLLTKAQFADYGVDTKAMFVEGILSTPADDADGDSVNPYGGIFERHQKNPVVLLNHNVKGLPIGRAETPDGRYTVRVNAAGDAVVGRCYFTDKNPLSYEVFSLYAEKIMRGWSINFRPMEAVLRPDPGVKGKRRGYSIAKWDLMEYSAVTIPNNPDTLAQRVSKGFHHSVNDELTIILRPYCTPAKVWAHGWAPVGSGWGAV